MRILRIHCSLSEPPVQCQWTVSDQGHVVDGQGRLTQLPTGIERVQLVIAAADVLLLKVKLPPLAHRRPGSALAFAVEEQLVGDPDANEVIWLGSSVHGDSIAVMNRNYLARWHDALALAGLHVYDIVCETLMLPRQKGEWSLAWNGREGFMRTAELEGAATDLGDRDLPPLSLRLMIEEARANGSLPMAVSIYSNLGSSPDTELESAIDTIAWQKSLVVPIHFRGAWSWRTAPIDAGVRLMNFRQRWQVSPKFTARLRPAAWIAGTALAIHAIASVADWASLAREERALRAQMEARFRMAVPDAIAVVDPVLQMRRKLTEARRRAGLPDSNDFLPMMGTVGTALRDLAPGRVRLLSYESGRIVLGLTVAESAVHGIVASLSKAGLDVDASPESPKNRDGMVVIAVRSQ